MSLIENKSTRLAQIEALLMDHPEGLTQSQIASRLGVHRSTILRNLVDLHAPTFEDNGKIIIDREAYLVNLRLNLHEALAIHLAGRMMTTRLDRQNPHAASALRKLGIALERLAPQISRFVRSSATSFENDTKLQDPRYLQVLEKLTIAWAKSQKVHLWYRSSDAGVVKEYTFCPFFIEVGAVGQAIYSIGGVEPADEMRTFKIELVERIELSGETFNTPMNFNPDKLMGQAWGIWYTNQEPVEVMLKFSPRVASRVRETRWHPGEQVVPLEDGSLIWRAFIAEPREMLPWVRGWGADVEVLEPESMLAELKREVFLLTKLYNFDEG